MMNSPARSGRCTPTDTREKISTATLIAAMVLVAASLVLPQVSTHQTLSDIGPKVPYAGSDYTISGYYIPTIVQGASINVSLCCYKPGTVLLTVFPTKLSDIAPTGPPLISIERPTAAVYSTSATSSETTPYGVLVISYNGTAYDLKISSSWSPFYTVRVYTVPLVFVVLAAGAATYYFRQTSKRRRDEKRVMDELRREAAEDRAE